MKRLHVSSKPKISNIYLFIGKNDQTNKPIKTKHVYLCPKTRENIFFWCLESFHRLLFGLRILEAQNAFPCKMVSVSLNPIWQGFYQFSIIINPVVFLFYQSQRLWGNRFLQNHTCNHSRIFFGGEDILVAHINAFRGLIKGFLNDSLGLVFSLRPSVQLTGP